MKILAVDVGTGTQDILLFDSTRAIENCLKMVMPSPTALVADAIRQATAKRQPVVLTGTLMGGGPSNWAADDHMRAGLRVYATPQAALSFNDELEAVARSGIRIISDDEAKRLKRVKRIEMRDFYLPQITWAFESFGLSLDDVDAYAVAVFDHGNAPAGASDRRFRFDFIAEALTGGGKLSAFAFPRDRIPPRMTRMQATASSVENDKPLLMMDTAPAAVLGALEDPRVRALPRAVIANVGNFHTLAFNMGDGQVRGVFEHHTGELTAAELEAYLQKLARGEVTNDEVFNDMGHGALVFDAAAPAPSDYVVIGPRRGLLRGSALQPYFAVPHGDMMIAGCFGLVRAFADHAPDWKDEIEKVLGQ
ncbi:MAG: DUF1786 domain-containing protein [Chloroflexi bacterium]|nr:DUF1786 domain-containing protein [Chloroflexota bacterium]